MGKINQETILWQKRVSKIRTQGSRMRSVNTTSEQSRLTTPKKSFLPQNSFRPKCRNFFCRKKSFETFSDPKKTKRTPPKFKGTKKNRNFFLPNFCFGTKKNWRKFWGLKSLFFENGDDRSLVVSFKPVFALRNGCTAMLFLLGL